MSGWGDTLLACLGRSLDDLLADGFARVVAEGLGFGEGPAWLPDIDSWLFSDVPGDRTWLWDEGRGLRPFQEPSRFANGHAALRAGGFLACEHLSRAVVVFDASGRRRVLCDRFDGQRLNSPNDVIEATDGAVWFTDPSYGILSDAEGRRARAEQTACRVYRVDPSGEVTVEVNRLSMPNGLCLSPAADRLYVADSGADMGPGRPFDPTGPRDVWAFPIRHGHVASEGARFFRVVAGVPDGIRCDAAGRLWVATGDGIVAVSPEGALIGRIEAGETVSNLCGGGRDGRDVLVTLGARALLIKPGMSATKKLALK